MLLTILKFVIGAFEHWGYEQGEIPRSRSKMKWIDERNWKFGREMIEIKKQIDR